jgi:5-methylcytosine-specific restriction endonuclease McrA
MDHEAASRERLAQTVKRINSMVKHELRKALCNKFGGCCAYCGVQIGMKGTVDHYMPQALGGTNEQSNLRWCCLKCNNLKADMHPDAWETKKPPRVDGNSKAVKKIQLLAAIAPCQLKERTAPPAALDSA